MLVWDGVTDARTEFNWEGGAMNNKTIVYMIENIKLISALLNRLYKSKGATIFEGATVENITFCKETVKLDLSLWLIVQLFGGKQLAARLLIGIDGANSFVRLF
jgi:ubiquinone biosynthesis monooxygenase Coq6